MSAVIKSPAMLHSLTRSASIPWFSAHPVYPPKGQIHTAVNIVLFEVLLCRKSDTLQKTWFWVIATIKDFC